MDIDVIPDLASILYVTNYAVFFPLATVEQGYWRGNLKTYKEVYHSLLFFFFSLCFLGLIFGVFWNRIFAQPVSIPKFLM